MLENINIFKKKEGQTSSSNDRGMRDSVLDFVQSVVIAIGFSIVIFTIVTPSEIEGPSMLPSFHNGERVYTNRLPQWFSETSWGKTLGLSYDRGDIIVFNKPGSGSSLIKRVVGLPNEKLKLQDGKVYINDKLFIEDYLDKGLLTQGESFWQEGQTLTVPSDSYIVLGDNRTVSNDSRNIGFIKRDWMQGKVIFRIWPLDQFGIIRQGTYFFN